jgi:hypothetical protein
MILEWVELDRSSLLDALISMGPWFVLELLNSETSLVDFLTSLGHFVDFLTRIKECELPGFF